jgi:hypothetical protein
MKTLFAGGASLCAVVAVAVGLIFGIGRAADPVKAVPPGGATEKPAGLVVHEWGTFTSFSGSDGVPVGFTPNNTDLPRFVYFQDGDSNSKSGRLHADGTVSMETPVLYFYTEKEMRASVRVDFPRGWITEWYPFAAAAPVLKKGDRKAVGQSIRWDVNLLAGQAARFPTEKGKNHYYQARETDAVPVQAEAVVQEDEDYGQLRGGTVVQKEKFLFYRGVGTFPPPMAVRALGNGKVQVKNNSGTHLAGLVLVTVHGGAVGFKALDELDAGAEATATIPEADKKAADLAAVMVKKLMATGLYEKEALAMVKTWDSAWFGEEGTRLLYLVPRTRTDELLPLTIVPKPTEIVRVLVGRHDFLTPEQEASAERLVRKSRAAQAEMEAAETNLREMGRFAYEARQMAVQRLDAKAAQK